MAAKKNILLEENARFSESMLWEIQRDFYDQQGVSAWVEQVPFYITSNPYIANGYAKIVIRFIQDWLVQQPRAAKQPFYILELGAGSGQFGFYVVKYLSEYIEKLKLNNITIKYVMTDFTENNVRFWKSHAALQPYVKKGLLDFAVFDFENDQTIMLQQSQQKLGSNSIANPVIVFANYLFDTVSSDVFAISQNELREARVSLSTPKTNWKNDRLTNNKKLKLTFTQQQIQPGYYQDPVLDKVLFSYKNKLEDSTILFPIGSLRGLQNILQMANAKMLLISSDKGYAELDELEDLDYPELDFHGSFSTMVNFEAIARYFQEIDGDCFLQTPRDGLVTAVFASGFKFEPFAETSLVLDQFVESLSPTDYFNFYETLLKTYKTANMHILASFLCLSRWDPFIFEEISDRIESLIADADEQIVNYLAKNMDKIAENFYFLPNCHDIFFDIGVFYQTAEDFEKAIHYFKLSEKYFGEDFAVFYNYGLCYFYQEKYQQALKNFERSLQLKPKAKDIKTMITKTKKALS